MIRTLSNDKVAFTNGSFELSARNYFNSSTSAPNSAASLQYLHGMINPATPHSQPLCQNILYQGKNVVVPGVVSLEEPSTEALPKGVQRSARNQLLGFSDQQIIVTYCQLTNRWTLPRSFLELSR
jgi:hypothetical protein